MNKRLARWIRFVADCAILFIGMYVFSMAMESLISWRMPTFFIGDWEHGVRGLFAMIWGVGVVIFAGTPIGIVVYVDSDRC